MPTSELRGSRLGRDCVDRRQTVAAGGVDDRIDASGNVDPLVGSVRWSPAKSIWFISMMVGWAAGWVYFLTFDAVIVLLVTTAVTLCLGHSLGMHRRFIHESFSCPSWLEWLGVWLGTLVGLGGPATMMRVHDLRDWAQRQNDCHPFLRHGSGAWRDLWWQVHCKLHLRCPPRFVPPARLRDSRVMQFLEATWMLQQVPVGIALFALGGWSYVCWGVCGRVVVSIVGHWGIGYLAHNHGQRDWNVDGAAVQGHNVRWCGLVTFGECWHNNHHAFPLSARLGLSSGQVDPGWWVLNMLAAVGLVWGLRLPEDLPPRSEVRRI